MGEPAVVLNEIDVELTLIGSLFSSQAVLEATAGEIMPEWFSDSVTRHMFERMRVLHQSGGRVAGPAMIASLPERIGDLNRNQFFARCCAEAVPANMIGGLVLTIKDRWARRQIASIGQMMQTNSTRFDVDPFSLAAEAVGAMDNVNVVRAERRGAFLALAADAVVANLDKPEERRGATTGLRALDNKLNGYTPGQLYVFAGRPGMGKSAMMVSSLRRTAAAGFGVVVFSLEMTSEEIASRAIADALDTPKAPPFGSIFRGDVYPDQKPAVAARAEEVANLPFYVDDSPRLTFSEIAAKARTQKAAYERAGLKLAVVCIDHMGLITPSDRYSGNKVAEAGEVSGQARALAKELGCCVLLLCQLSRDVEKRDDRRPVMSDLRWSGEIEQDAHVIGFLYREAYYLEQDANADPVMVADARNRLDFLIRKNRNGETGDVRLWCSIAHSSIRDS